MSENEREVLDREFDEKTVIMEQERLARVKKRKKHKKIKIAILIVVILLIAATVWYIFWGAKMIAAKQDEKTVDIVIENGQTLSYVKIDTIYGNEITVTYLDEVVKEDSSVEPASESKLDSNTDSKTDSNSKDTTDKPSFGGDGSFTPPSGSEGFNPSKGGFTPPSSGDDDNSNSKPSRPDSGSMPNMSSMPDVSDLPEVSGSSDSNFPFGVGFGGGNFGGFSGSFDPSNFGGSNDGSRASGTKRDTGLTIGDITYTLGNESKTMYVPVGTIITTKLGTETTFSRLQAGDYIGIVTEKNGDEEVIVSIYIVG